FPESRSCWARGTLSNIHRAFVAEKYGSIGRPVFRPTSSVYRRSFLHFTAVRLSSHTIAGYTGLPVRLSHRITVSRWFVMARPSREFLETPLKRTASRSAWMDTFKILPGLCSTQPRWGIDLLRG